MTKELSPSEARAKLIGLAIYPFIGGLFFMWYNHVLFQYPIAYWKLVVISIPVAFMQYSIKPSRYIVVLTSVVAMFGQVLAWIGMIALPLFHL